jgi:hypothetical protein
MYSNYEASMRASRYVCANERSLASGIEFGGIEYSRGKELSPAIVDGNRLGSFELNARSCSRLSEFLVFRFARLPRTEKRAAQGNPLARESARQERKRSLARSRNLFPFLSFLRSSTSTYRGVPSRHDVG